MKASFGLVSGSLALQVFSLVADCESVLASTHIAYSIEILPSVGIWWVEKKYFSAHPGLRCWLGVAEVVRLPRVNPQETFGPNGWIGF